MQTTVSLTNIIYGPGKFIKVACLSDHSTPRAISYQFSFTSVYIILHCVNGFSELVAFVPCVLEHGFIIF